jgi:hypothetical protein
MSFHDSAILKDIADYGITAELEETGYSMLQGTFFLSTWGVMTIWSAFEGLSLRLLRGMKEATNYDHDITKLRNSITEQSREEMSDEINSGWEKELNHAGSDPSKIPGGDGKPRSPAAAHR